LRERAARVVGHADGQPAGGEFDQETAAAKPKRKRAAKGEDEPGTSLEE
jgi:hypothetical protein